LHKTKTTLRNELIGWLLCAPALVVFAIFFVAPMLVALYLSFFKWDGTSPEILFIGLQNYADILLGSRFWNAIYVTLVALALMLVKLPIALLLAAGLARPTMINAALRTSYFIPHMLAATTAAVIWILLLDPYQGLINNALQLVGLSDWQRGWLGDPATALPAAMVAALWWTFGIYVVLYGAAIPRIPADYYDVVRLESRLRWHSFRHVTLPFLREQIFVSFVMTVGGIFGTLTGFLLLLTQGGPSGRTETVGLMSVSLAFRALDFGRASAVSLIMLVIVFAVIIVPTIRIAKKSVEF